MGKKERSKGGRGEREHVNWIKSHSGWTAKRTAPIQTAGGDFPDVMAFDPSGREYICENKNRKNPPKWALYILDKGHDWVRIKPDYKEAVFLVSHEFMDLAMKCIAESCGKPEKYNGRAKHWPKRPLGSKHGRGE